MMVRIFFNKEYVYYVKITCFINKLSHLRCTLKSLINDSQDVTNNIITYILL